MVERRFWTMGTEIGVLVGRRLDTSLPSEDTIAAELEAELVDFDLRLSRFRPDSELSQLNADPRDQVPASPLLRSAVSAAIWVTERTAGLVDPTVLPALEAAGYASSRERSAAAPLDQALAAAPPRAAARPDPGASWRAIEVLDDAGLIRRPPGLRIDLGGSGKGLAADLAARRLDGYARYAIDCGGDLRVGGSDPFRAPFEIEVRHPLTGAAADAFTINSGAVATSGLDARLWRLPDERFAHHLIDPATGKPAWTGIVCATARAPTALEADALAKAALLSGADGAQAFLAEHGGVTIADDGHVERIGPLHDLPRVRCPSPR